MAPISDILPEHLQQDMTKVINCPYGQLEVYPSLLSAKGLQMLQNRQVGVHPSFHAVVCAGLFCPVQTSRGNLSSDALLPADVGEVVNG